jgi:hypothetical protein
MKAESTRCVSPSTLDAYYAGPPLLRNTTVFEDDYDGNQSDIEDDHDVALKQRDITYSNSENLHLLALLPPQAGAQDFV